MAIASMATPHSLRVFASTLSLLGSILTLAPNAFAAGTCPDGDPGKPPYNAPRAPQSVCTAADLKVFEDEVSKSGTTWEKAEAAMTAQSAACSKCIFSDFDDKAWGAVVLTVNGGALNNSGGCIQAKGGSSTCAAIVTRRLECINARCALFDGYCESKSELDACVDTVGEDSSSCGQYSVSDACSDDEVASADECQDPVAIVEAMCAAEPAEPEPDTKGNGASTTRPTEDAEDAAEDASPTESGCAQGRTNSSGSIASALLLACAIGCAIRKRRARAAP